MILIDGVRSTRCPVKLIAILFPSCRRTAFSLRAPFGKNITYGLDSYSEEEFQKAVEDADIPEFLPSLPDGIDTQVGEHGDKLSGGQKQRICIARAPHP